MTTGLDRWNRVCACGHSWGNHSLLDPDDETRCLVCECAGFNATEDMAGLDRRNHPIGGVDAAS